LLADGKGKKWIRRGLAVDTGGYGKPLFMSTQGPETIFSAFRSAMLSLIGLCSGCQYNLRSILISGNVLQTCCAISRNVSFASFSDHYRLPAKIKGTANPEKRASNNRIRGSSPTVDMPAETKRAASQSRSHFS